jgi:hypothetical protein
MKRERSALIWGVILVGLGILFLLQNFGLIGTLADLLWSLVFAAGGLAFLYVFVTRPEHWWAAIPGMALLGIGGLIGLNAIWPALGDYVGGSMFLGMLGLSFVLVYLRRREHWWAVIPAGTLLTLAGVAFVEALPLGIDGGGIFFLGVGLTFLLLSALPTPQGRMRWALIPAGVLVVMGMLLMAQSMLLFRYLWPLAFILGGLYLVLRNARRTPQE